MLSKILFTLLFSATAFAQNPIDSAVTCFKAINPEAISVVTMDDQRILNTTEAMMNLTPAHGEYFSQMTLAMKTETGEQIAVMGFDFNKTNGAEFKVECDGGGVNLARMNDRAIEANTGYIAGEIVNVGYEGCASVRIAMDKVQFTQVSCQALAE